MTENRDKPIIETEGVNSMDNTKIGKLICSLRKEHGMTQLQLAERMNISDKTVSKWERGLGCPDVSLISELSRVLNVDIDSLLIGELDVNKGLGASMRRIKFYVCKSCGNIITSLSDISVSCCGKKLLPLEAKKADDKDQLTVEKIENDYFISSEHEMTKEHYISFVALISGDAVMIRKQYPEWDLQVRFPAFARGRLVWHCVKHGLFWQEIQ